MRLSKIEWVLMGNMRNPCWCDMPSRTQEIRKQPWTSSTLTCDRESVMLAEIAMLWEMTSHANSGGDDMKLKFSGYCSLLMDYPADVAFETLKRALRFKWFPARSELAEIADRLERWRRVTRDALEAT